MTTDIASPPAGAAVPLAKAPASRGRIVAVGIALALAGGGGAYHNHARHFEDTDDAQIDGEITGVSPRVPGTLIAVKVKDNQVITAGDVVAEIDPVDYEVALAQARAQLAQAQAVFQAENPSVSMTETTNQTTLSSAEADVLSADSGQLAVGREIQQLTAQLELAKANEKTAQQEKGRTAELHKSGSISQAELDNRTNAADASSANVA